MASSEQITSLIQAGLDHDLERFKSISLQISAHEASNGHKRLSQDIKSIIKKTMHRTRINLEIDQTELLTASQPEHRLSQLIAYSDVQRQLMRIINEQGFMTKLKSHGLSPRRKVLGHDLY